MTTLSVLRSDTPFEILQGNFGTVTQAADTFEPLVAPAGFGDFYVCSFAWSEGALATPLNTSEAALAGMGAELGISLDGSSAAEVFCVAPMRYTLRVAGTARVSGEYEFRQPRLVKVGESLYSRWRSQDNNVAPTAVHISWLRVVRVRQGP